jgi:hypothetical protein
MGYHTLLCHASSALVEMISQAALVLPIENITVTCSAIAIYKHAAC